MNFSVFCGNDKIIKFSFLDVNVSYVKFYVDDYGNK
jgi:hypothetical protein